MQIPSPSSCRYNGALLMLAAWLLQRPGSKRKSLGLAVKHKSHLTADLLWDSVCVCVSEWLSVRGRPVVCSPFPQIQLCKGSWPHCPTERRQRCEGWQHSSLGSPSPVEKEGRYEKDKLEIPPHGFAPPWTSQVAVNVHICLDSYVLKTWKEFNKRCFRYLLVKWKWLIFICLQSYALVHYYFPFDAEYETQKHWGVVEFYKCPTKSK